MKRIFIMAFALFSAWAACAQNGLHVEDIFEGKVVPRRQMKETVIRGEKLDPFNLEHFYSVAFAGDETVLQQVSARVLADSDLADDQEVHRDGGILTYAILTFEGKNRENRYVCYQCMLQEGGHYGFTLVYMSGPATLEDLKRLFKKR